MAGPYSVLSLADVLQHERGSLPPGATIALVTSIITRSLAGEIRDLQSRGYKVLVLFSGDGGPAIRLSQVPVYLLGRALEALETETTEQDEPVLAS